MNRDTYKHPKHGRDDTLLNLDRNESCDAGIVNFINKFIKNIDANSIIKYPNLKKAYSSLYKLGLDADNVLLTSGSEEAIRLVIQSHKDAKSIAFPEPTYKMIEIFADIFKLFPTKMRYDKYFKFNISEADIIYIANPDNTTGSLLTIEEIESICKLNKVTIIDEAYYEFSRLTVLPLLEKYDNLYIIRTFSKAFSVAGIRIGMVISSVRNIERIIEIKPAYDINAIACEFMHYIKMNEMITSVNRIKNGKMLIEFHLHNNGFEVIDTYANFVLVKYDEKLFNHISQFARVAIITINDERYIRITAPDVDTVREKMTWPLK